MAAADAPPASEALKHDASHSWVQPHTELVGVLGGLGPAASASFTQRMVAAGAAAGASLDAHHTPYLMFCNPVLPNAWAASRGTGASPEDGYVASFTAMGRAGATAVAVVCNTAHAFARPAAV